MCVRGEVDPGVNWDSGEHVRGKHEGEVCVCVLCVCVRVSWRSLAEL